MNSVARWYAIYCKSKQERTVRARLEQKAIHAYLADHETRVRWGNRWRKVRKNLLPGYLLIRAKIDPQVYLQVLQTQGVVKFVGNPWPALSAIPDREVESLQLLLGSRLPVTEVPYWQRGQWVEVVGGPLTGLTGRLASATNGKRRVVVSIELLKRSISVEIDVGFLRQIGRQHFK